MQSYYYPRLKDLREDRDLNQKQVADIIGTTQQYYGRYEKGTIQIPLDRAIKLAKFYNVSLDYIAGLTNDKGGLHRSEKNISINQSHSNRPVVKIKE